MLINFENMNPRMAAIMKVIRNMIIIVNMDDTCSDKI